MITKSKTQQPRNKLQGIGSSEIATVLGINKYQTPWQLWRIKTGKEDGQEENRHTLAGHMLEPAVASYFENVTGHSVMPESSKAYVVGHPTIPYVFCSPDREYTDKTDGAICLLECKTTQKAIDKDDIPLEWFCQLQYQLGITGHKKGAIAWLTRGLDFDFMEFDFDPGFFAEMLTKVEAFWVGYVMKGIEPPMQNEKDVLIRFPVSVSKTIEATEEMQAVHVRIVSLSQKIKELEQEREALADQVKIAMQDAEKVEYADMTLFTWKTSKGKLCINSKDLAAKYPEAFNACKFTAKPARPFVVKD